MPDGDAGSGAREARLRELEAAARERTARSADRDAILAALRRMGLVPEGDASRVPLTPLTGGVSSDIYRADLPGGPVCVKRALPRLKVAADWRAPTERNRYEAQWLRFAAGVVPDAVPRVLAVDDDGLAFAMEWLDPQRYPVWKTLLLQGVAEPAFAGDLGRRLAAIHAASADRDDLAQAFATDASFHALRLDPYLLEAARRHPALRGVLTALVERTAATRRVLVHGDVSPKNILRGPRGPVLVDAECAWFGDPAFDLAFCLNHLLLKCVRRPAQTPEYLACFDALARAYLTGVRWEPAAQLEARAATLLCGLLLARVDGKSPVEYLRAPGNRALVRAFAQQRLHELATGCTDVNESLDRVVRAWQGHLQATPPVAEDA